MTDNEIIKALEYCCHNGYCKKCPHSCVDNKNIEDLALDLINRQKAEIERLNTAVNIAEYDKYKAEFEEYKAEIQDNAIKEFAERLKERYTSVWTHDGHEEAVLVLHESLDNLVKEMVGDEDG